MKIGKKHALGENLLYLLVWSAIILVPVLNSQMLSELHVNLDEAWIVWRQIIPYMVIFLVHNHLIAPRYLLKKRYALYLLTNVIFVTIVFVIIDFYQMNIGHVSLYGSFTNHEVYWNILFALFMNGTNGGIKLLYQSLLDEQQLLRLKEENPELNGIAKPYNLRGFSFREYLNLKTGNNFRSYTLEEILTNHEQIARTILPKVSPNAFFQNYLHHGFYPFFLEKRNFSENLLKTMNAMMEVDILIVQQIELKYLAKIKKLLYLLAVNGPQAPNVSKLAEAIQTSRATVMNYIKYLADARLINMVYNPGDSFPKKPAKIMMHNTNLVYGIYPVKVDDQDVLETFLANALWKDHTVNKGGKGLSFLVDEKLQMRVCTEGIRVKNNPDVYYIMHRRELGRENQIPLWLFGFLY